ncbi:GNAT family protein [Leptospira sp. 96542]|nr:GNAT family protein [Leptospira sp. 96542]
MLRGSQVELRAWQEDDVSPLLALRNDVALQNMLIAQARPNSVERVRRWLVDKSGREDGLFFVIAELTSQRCLGYLQLIDMHPLHGTAELGICIAPGAQGQGYGREALRLLEDYAHRMFSLRKIVLRVRADIPAAKFYPKIGYREVGCLRSHVHVDGQYLDVLMMEKILFP